MKFRRQTIQIFKRLLLLLPIWLLNIYKKKNYENKKIEIRDKSFSDLPNQEIFSIIYRNKLWNPNNEMDFNLAQSIIKKMYVNKKEFKK